MDRRSIRKFSRLLDRGFTIIEIMVVVVIFSIIAGFGIAGYGKLVRKSRERNAIMIVTAIHQANEIYFDKYGEYLDGNNFNETQLSVNHPNGLEINIRLSGLTNIKYTRTSPNTYWANAGYWVGTSFNVRVFERPLSTVVAPPNPCCNDFPDCPSLLTC